MPKNDNLFIFTDFIDDKPDEAGTEGHRAPAEPIAPIVGNVPVAQEPAPAEEVVTPVAEEPVAEEPVAEESVAEESVAEESVEEDVFEEDEVVIETTPIADEPASVNEDELDEFAAPATAQSVIEPSFTGTADALTAAPKAHTAPAEELEDDVALSTAPDAQPASDETTEEDDTVSAKRHPFMRFLGAIVPHVGDAAFDVVRKCIMLAGILVFIGAATYLVDDLILIPIHNDVLVESLQQMYSPDIEQTLSEEEQNYKYPKDIDPAFKKLYYQNNDVRGWLRYQTTDLVTFNIDYPIVQSADNDYYLFHDFNRTYNKNGTLFFDYRNDFTSKKAKNRNTVIYGHNMASGQMLAGLNRMLLSVDYARVAPTFTMNTIYKQCEYKVFAVMLLNNSEVDGIPFAYLRTDFKDNVEFAGFLSEIKARSLYDYGDVDVRPDDEIVMLSTCTDWDIAHFKDGRTVVVARKVRKDEKPETDVMKIDYNPDVIMPYAWYINQKLEPHPYYTDPKYIIPPLDTLMDFLATSTVPDGETTTALTMYQNGTYGPLVTTMTDAEGNIITGTQNTKPVVVSISVESTPVYYSLGSGFDYDNTKVVALYSDGKKKAIKANTLAVTGFSSAKVGTCKVTMHYGALNVSFEVKIIDGIVAPLNPTTTVTTTTTTVTTTTTTTTRHPNFVAFTTTARTFTPFTTTTTTAPTETTTQTEPETTTSTEATEPSQADITE